MKDTSHTEVLIIAATAIFIIVIASFFFLNKDKESFIPKKVVAPPESSEAGAAQLDASLPSNSELENLYKEKSREILKFYSPDSLNLEGAKKVYGKIVDDLLDLKVPRSYQSIHLKLVMNFEKLSELIDKVIDGDKQAEAEFNKVKEDLDNLFSTYPWLRN